VKEIIERRDDMIVISTFTKKSFEVLPIWRLSTMDPSGRTVSNVIQDQVRVCILHIGQDLAILTRCRTSNENCYVPSCLLFDGLAPHGKRAR
jgi:hypothetical protein